MPWKDNKGLLKSMPELKKLPSKAITMFRKVANKMLGKGYDESKAVRIAWEVVKKKFKKQPDGSWVAKGLGYKVYNYKFDLNKKNGFIQKAEDGEEYIEAVLADNQPDLQGEQFSTKALKRMAEEINTHGVPAFIGHENWKSFYLDNNHLTKDNFIAKARKRAGGIIKKVKALVDKGKLWVKAFIDKRYKNHVKKFNKVSIEAIARERKGKQILDSSIAGFCLDNDAVNPRAKITS